MKVGVIADDFTGASDIALTLAEGGMATALVTGDGPIPDCDAAVIALKSRTAPVAEAIADSLTALDRLSGAERIILKVCSTFDSTPDGNIGPVAEALGAAMGADRSLVCPAFPEAGRRVFMGHLFVGDVPLNESGMQDHPLTPMTDSDLRRVMAAQSNWPVGHVPWTSMRGGVVSMDGPGHWIADAVEEADLIAMGHAGARLMVGGSGIALGLPDALGQSGAAAPWQAATGQGLILSGSCSRATRGQVAAWSGPRREVTAAEAVEARVTPQDLVNWAAGQVDAPLIFSSADPETVRAAQSEFGTEVVSTALETLFAETAALAVAGGLGRLIVAGGETSGAVVSRLAPGALHVGPRLAAGVPALRTSEGLALALKSGNFGEVDFFQTALARMAR